MKLGEDGEEVAFAAVGLDVIFLQKDLENFGNASGLAQQLPNSCSDGIEAVVDAIFEAENGRFIAERTRDLVGGSNDDGLQRDRYAHLDTPPLRQL